MDRDLAEAVTDVDAVADGDGIADEDDAKGVRGIVEGAGVVPPHAEERLQHPLPVRPVRGAAPRVEELARNRASDLYDLQRPSTLRNNQQKQIGLLTAADVPFDKLYIFHG